MKRRHLVLKKVFLLIIAAAVIIPSYFLISQYISNQPTLKYAFSNGTSQNMVAYPDANFAVISDLHYYDKSLGTTGKVFEECLNSDRKLLKDSADILDFTIDNIIKSNAKFVLISGDMTKDGELICHQKVSNALRKLRDRGIGVYAIPGNHDVNNPGSVKYEDNKSISVPNITAADFTNIYNDCGYSNAVERDTNSLSYVAEPVNNLWLVALDTCRYRENKPGGTEIISGKLSQNQELWLEGILKKANENKKAVIIMEHHGVVEHWNGQRRLHPDYLVEDYKYISKMLASYNVRLAFTGHYHAQDIALEDFGKGGFIYDIETGSLITPPCAIRNCTISNNKIRIISYNIVDKLHSGTDFEKKAINFVYNTLETEVYNKLRKYLVPQKDAQYIAQYLSHGFVAHYNGDENIADRPPFDENKLGLWSRFVLSQQKYVIEGIWKDTAPEDNNVVLELDKTH